MIKYASNALLATLISFTNELANLGAALGGIDTIEVMRGVHLSQYFRTATRKGSAADHVVPQGGMRFWRQLPARRTSTR